MLKILLFISIIVKISGVLREYKSLIVNQIEVIDLNQQDQNPQSQWLEAPFQNELCIKNDFFNKQFQEYRKDSFQFFSYTQKICESITNRLIEIIPWNTTIYAGVFTNNTLIYLTGFSEGQNVKFQNLKGQFTIAIMNPKPNFQLSTDDILLYSDQKNIFFDIDNNYDFKIPFIIQKIQKNIRKNTLNRSDNKFVDQYVVVFDQIITLDSNQETIHDNYLLKVNIQDRAEGWMINKIIFKMEVLDLYSCQFTANGFCATCQSNGKLNSLNQQCQCNDGYEKGFLFNEYQIYTNEFSGRAYYHYRCINQEEKQQLLIQYKFNFPSYNVQNLLHYFSNSQIEYEFALLDFKQNNDLFRIMKANIQGFSEFNDEAINLLDYSDLIAVIQVREITLNQYNQFESFRDLIFIENLEIIQKKYNKKFSKENFEILNVIRGENYQYLRFSDETINMKWIDKKSIKIYFNKQFLGDKQIFFKILFWTMGPHEKYIPLSPQHAVYLYYNYMYLSLKGVQKIETYDIYTYSLPSDQLCKGQEDIMVLLEGMTENKIKMKAFLCEDRSCTRYKIKNQINSYPSINYMKVFTTDPSIQGTLLIDKINYINQYDSYERFLVVIQETRYNFRPNEIIISFIANSEITQDDHIRILLFASFVQFIDNNDNLRNLQQNFEVSHDTGFLKVITQPFDDLNEQSQF